MLPFHRRPGPLVAHFPRILGTSLEILWLPARAGARRFSRVERAILRELERLDRILSVHRSDSEWARWLRTHGVPVEVSAEVADVLVAAAAWRTRTGGAFDPTVDTGIAARLGLPDPGHRPALSEPPWEVERETGTGRTFATRFTAGLIDPDGLAKGYVLDRACAAGWAEAGEGTLSVNLGGDLRVLGEGPIEVGVTDPRAPAENVAPLVRLRVGACGVATSGGYRRVRVRDGRRSSHILDPRTGDAAEGVLGATAMASSAMEADALATTLCVLDPREGRRLVEGLSGAGALWVLADGSLQRGGVWAAPSDAAA